MSRKKRELWSDEELLERIQANDRMAYEVIYNRYWSKLYLSAFSILKDRQISEDIVQEIYVQLWTKRHANSIENLKAYLFTAIRFQVFKTIRTTKVRADLIEQLEKINFEDSTQDYVYSKEINALLESSIEKLPVRCREIFILSRKEHLSVKEIANRMGISPKTVENQITIAIKKLRISMGEVLLWTSTTLIFIWMGR